MRMRVTRAACFLAAAFAMPLMAHHSIAEYDNSKVVTLNGAVTSVDWRNPHVHIHVDVPDAQGHVINWNLETWGLGQLAVRGLTNGFIKPGDRVRADVYLAKDGAAKAVVRALPLS